MSFLESCCLSNSSAFLRTPTDSQLAKVAYSVSVERECTKLAYRALLDFELVVGPTIISLCASEAYWAILATYVVSVNASRPQRSIAI